MTATTRTQAAASATQYPADGDKPIMLGTGPKALTARIVRWHSSNDLCLYFDTGAAEIAVVASSAQLVDLAAAAYAACGDQLIADQLGRAAR